jgi:hypothetical protein
MPTWLIKRQHVVEHVDVDLGFAIAKGVRLNGGGAPETTRERTVF